MRNLLIITFAFITSVIYSQESNTSKTIYQNYTSYGMLIGSLSDKQTHIHHFQMDNNFIINKHISTGVTTGITKAEIKLLSIGPNIKYIINPDSKTCFYMHGSLGHAISLDDYKLEYYNPYDTKGGRFAQTELGYLFSNNRKMNFFIAAGFQYNEFSYKLDNWFLSQIKNKIKYNRFTIKLGVRIL